jgi:hypothetical protein
MSTIRRSRPGNRALVLLLLLVGCASSSGTAAPNSAPAHSNSDVITRQELADPSLAGSTVVEALRRLRPRFLNERGAALKGAPERVQISLNGAEPVPLGELSRLELVDIEEIRYLSVADAGLRFGLRGNMVPVLLVTLRRR